MLAGMALALVMAAEVAGRPVPASGPRCPEERDVDAELARLGATRSERPEISIEGDTMRVILRGPDGATVGSREVEAPASCHERATVAAVLVATWMGIWPEAPRPALPSPPARVEPEPTLQAQKPGPSRTEIGLVLAGVYDGNDFSPGATIETRLALSGPLRGVVGLTATAERDKDVGSWRAGYTRPALELGAALVVGHGRIRGEARSRRSGGPARPARQGAAGRLRQDPHRNRHRRKPALALHRETPLAARCPRRNLLVDQGDVDHRGRRAHGRAAPLGRPGGCGSAVVLGPLKSMVVKGWALIRHQS